MRTLPLLSSLSTLIVAVFAGTEDQKYPSAPGKAQIIQDYFRSSGRFNHKVLSVELPTSTQLPPLFKYFDCGNQIFTSEQAQESLLYGCKYMLSKKKTAWFNGYPRLYESSATSSWSENLYQFPLRFEDDRPAEFRFDGSEKYFVIFYRFFKDSCGFHSVVRKLSVDEAGQSGLCRLKSCFKKESATYRACKKKDIETISTSPIAGKEYIAHRASD